MTVFGRSWQVPLTDATGQIEVGMSFGITASTVSLAGGPVRASRPSGPSKAILGCWPQLLVQCSTFLQADNEAPSFFIGRAKSN